jgi:hypothetical protein
MGIGKGIRQCAVAAFKYEHATAEILAQALAVLPKDAGIITIRDNPKEHRFEFLFGSSEFPESMVSKKRLDFPMIKFTIENGQFAGYDIPGTPPTRAKIQ